MKIKKQFRYVLLFIFTLIIMGCSKMFLPSPPENERWVKRGHNLIEVNKAMDECSYPGYKFPRETSLNEIAEMHLCMEKKGFKYIGRFGSACQQYPSLPACIEARGKRGK